MKILALVLLPLLFACAPLPSLEELEEQALVSGDWSRVEARERLIAEKNAEENAINFCDYSGRIYYCEVSGLERRCSCIERRALNQILSFSPF